jgi:hypothetical protein
LFRHGARKERIASHLTAVEQADARVPVILTGRRTAAGWQAYRFRTVSGGSSETGPGVYEEIVVLRNGMYGPSFAHDWGLRFNRSMDLA